MSAWLDGVDSTRAGAALTRRCVPAPLRLAQLFACGAVARVEPALRKAFTEHKDDLVFMDFIIDPVANVFPMVAAGKGLTEMILAEDL